MNASRMNIIVFSVRSALKSTLSVSSHVSTAYIGPSRSRSASACRQTCSGSSVCTCTDRAPPSIPSRSRAIPSEQTTSPSSNCIIPML